MQNFQDRSITKIIYTTTSDPSVEPISLAEAKIDLKVDNTDEDELINILRQAARETVEQHTNRSLITQTRVAKLDWFPCSDTILLPNGPVQSVTTVKYYDASNVLTTMSSGDYWVDSHSGIPRIVVKNYWPETYTRPHAVEVTYVCGYGAAGSDVPAPLRKACLFILGHFYENRQQVIVSGSSMGAMEIPFGAQVLMAPYVLEQNITY